MELSKAAAISKFFNEPSPISGPVQKAGVTEVKELIDSLKKTDQLDEYAIACATALGATLK